MSRTLYCLVFYLALPLILFRLLWRSVKAPAYRLRWNERLGFYSKAQTDLNPQGKSIVFHAVSVGEVHAAVPLIRQVQKEFPLREIIVTTSTPTGSDRVKAIFGDSVGHVYLPYDFPGAVKRFLNFARADVVIILETELWPNLIHYCGCKSVKVMLVNARLSEKSLRSYQKISGLAQQMMSGLSVVAAQSDDDAKGFIRLGLPPAVLHITGSMKFDVKLDKEQVATGQALKAALNGRPVLVAGSTREGEEEKVLEAFQLILNELPNTLLVLVPRHPERFSAVAALVKGKGLNLVKRTDEQNISTTTQVLIGDSMGEMQLFYSMGDIAFVGGSLVETGCQNIIEPAALGLPVITGPSLFNFKAISEMLLEAGGMQVAKNVQALAQITLVLLKGEGQRSVMSLKALDAVKANQGATGALMGLIKRVVD